MKLYESKNGFHLKLLPSYKSAILYFQNIVKGYK